MTRQNQPFLGRTAPSVRLSWMQHSNPCVVIRDNGSKVLPSSPSYFDAPRRPTVGSNWRNQAITLTTSTTGDSPMDPDWPVFAQNPTCWG